MFRAPSQKTTDLILHDDTQYIDNQIIKGDRKRFHLLGSIMLLQGIWSVVIGIFVHKMQLVFPSLPILLIAFLIMFDCRISKVGPQKMAKCLFIYTLLRSFGSLLVFLYISLQHMRGHIPGGWIFGGTNLIIEFLTLSWTLQVLRLTNQDLVWNNRKMSPEDGLRYNC